MDRLEGYDLRVGGVVLPEELLQVERVVVAKDLLLGARVDHSDHHGVVVALVGEDDAVGDHLAQGGEGCVVGHIAGGEDEGALLPVEVGQLPL